MTNGKIVKEVTSPFGDRNSFLERYLHTSCISFFAIIFLFPRYRLFMLQTPCQWLVSKMKTNNLLPPDPLHPVRVACETSKTVSDHFFTAYFPWGKTHFLFGVTFYRVYRVYIGVHWCILDTIPSSRLSLPSFLPSQWWLSRMCMN